jgi:adhesin transport system outer membrane protein
LSTGLLWMSVIAPSAHAESTRSLAATMEKTVLSHPEVRARYHDFISTLEGQNIQQGGLRPQVSVEAWSGKEWRTGSSTDPSTNWSRNGYTLQLSQLLFDGFATLNTVRQHGYEKVSAYFTLLHTVDSLALEAGLAHLDVLRYRELQRLAQENWKAHVDTHAQIQERQESGVGRGVDLEQSTGRLALAQANLMTESGNLNDVTQRYQRLVGDLPPAMLQDAPDVKRWLPSSPTSFVSELRSNPELLAKQALVQAGAATVQAAKGAHQPTLEVRASSGKDHSQPGLPYRDAHSSNVQLVLSYNLYRGGADQARVRQTKAQEYAARDVRDYTCRNVQQELSIAWNNIIKLREQIPFLQQHVDATTRVRTAYQQQFQIGERSLLDVLDTENELFDARRALANAEVELRREELRWLMRSHRLLQAMSISQPYDTLPEEAAKLDFPSEAALSCATAMPDTDSLRPLDVRYQDDLKPPVLVPTTAQSR